MRSLLESVDAFHINIRNRLTFGQASQVLTGAITIDADAPPFQVLDTGGVIRNVIMPAPVRGRFFILLNISAGAFGLAVKKADGTTTSGTVAQGKMAIVASDGLEWYYAALA